jgi:hypothetical protein
MGTAYQEPVLNGLHGLRGQLHPLSLPAPLAKDREALPLLVEVCEVKRYELSTAESLRPQDAKDGFIPGGGARLHAHGSRPGTSRRFAGAVTTCLIRGSWLSGLKTGSWANGLTTPRYHPRREGPHPLYKEGDAPGCPAPDRTADTSSPRSYSAPPLIYCAGRRSFWRSRLPLTRIRMTRFRRIKTSPPTFPPEKSIPRLENLVIEAEKLRSEPDDSLIHVLATQIPTLAISSTFRTSPCASNGD